MEKRDYIDIIGGLASEIKRALTPLVNSDYVLLDCPYHYNIGDSLIWQGELDFLSGLPYRMLGHSSVFTYNDRIKIDPSTLILLHGGGNFGDLWRRHSDHRLRLIEKYPDNHIIILPQTVYYENADVMKADAETFARHRKLTICARDRRSYDLLKENFSNEVLLVPDMAFCIDMEAFTADISDTAEGLLYLKRGDRELAAAQAEIPTGADILDWPSSNKWSRTGLTFFLLRGSAIALGCGKTSRGIYYKACASTDNFAINRFLPHAVRTGVGFISSYEHIYTTRLHGAILSMLCGRSFTLIDNSYGKNSSFFETWFPVVSR